MIVFIGSIEKLINVCQLEMASQCIIGNVLKG